MKRLWDRRPKPKKKTHWTGVTIIVGEYELPFKWDDGVPIVLGPDDVIHFHPSVTYPDGTVEDFGDFLLDRIFTGRDMSELDDARKISTVREQDRFKPT